MKAVVQLAIDAAEAAVVLGARALCAVTAAAAEAPDTTTEASPEAADQPLASAVALSADDLQSAAFACRKHAERLILGAAQPYWHGIADRLDYSSAIGRQLEATNE